MLKKTVTFENLDGEMVTRDYYFNLNKAELMKIQTSTKGGFDKKLAKINNEQDVNGLLEFIREIILMSYGEKDDDGIKFIKKRNGVSLAEEFEQTEAFSQIYMELISGDKAAENFNAFIQGIIPSDIQAQAKQELAKQIEAKK